MVNDVGRSIDRGAPPSSEPAATSSTRPTASRAMRSRGWSTKVILRGSRGIRRSWACPGRRRRL